MNSTQRMTDMQKNKALPYPVIGFKGYTMGDRDPQTRLPAPFRFLTNLDGMPVMQLDFPNGWTVSIIQSVGRAFYHVGAYPQDGHFLNPGQRDKEYHSDYGEDEVTAFIMKYARRR